MKVIFLDRDGVINHDDGYTYKIEEFKFIDGVFEACKTFKTLGFEIIIVTNQSGIGRKYYNEDDFNILTTWMVNEFRENGIDILDVFFCPHLPNDNCNCRKPKIGMIEKALTKYDICIKESWLIGDKESDIETAVNAGIANKILITNNNNSTNSYVAKNLFDTIPIIRCKVNNEIQ